MGFDGCGVTDGCAGTLFAKGLDKQCDQVRRQLDAFLGERVPSGQLQRPVRVNVVGLSRGGIACLYLAQRLADLTPSQCKLCMLLFDPVPGNLLTQRQLDVCGCINAHKCCDVSMCQCLSRVLAIYPHEPLPAIAFHAPVLCNYPDSCDVEEEVTLGCHQGALFTHRLCLRPGQAWDSIDLPSALSFLRIRRWLFECGTSLNEVRLAQALCPDRTVPTDKTVPTDEVIKNLENACLSGCNEQLGTSAPTRRCSHCAGSIRGAVIRRYKPGRAHYLNRHHELLAQSGSGEWLLQIRRDEKPFPYCLLVLSASVVCILVVLLI